MCQSNYNLDPNYYYTLPSFAWDAFLKYSKVDLALLSDYEIHLFVESGIRGGLSMIPTRYSKANNKYLDDYDKSKDDVYISYLDANNLYGGAMCNYLPYDGFQWNTEEWTKENIMALDDECDIGYMFSVDLHIKQELHEYFNGYVPLPVTTAIKKSLLSPNQQIDYNENKVTKLCCTFEDREDPTANLFSLNTLVIPQPSQHLQSRYTVISHYLSP